MECSLSAEVLQELKFSNQSVIDNRTRKVVKVSLSKICDNDNSGFIWIDVIPACFINDVFVYEILTHVAFDFRWSKPYVITTSTNWPGTLHYTAHNLHFPTMLILDV